MSLYLINSRKRVLVRPRRIHGLLASGRNAVVNAIAFIGAVRNVIRPFQFGEINILSGNVLNGRIRGFAEGEGVARIRNHTPAMDTTTRARLGSTEIG
jgi:hypothetical protein